MCCYFWTSSVSNSPSVNAGTVSVSHHCAPQCARRFCVSRIKKNGKSLNSNKTKQNENDWTSKESLWKIICMCCAYTFSSWSKVTFLQTLFPRKQMPCLYGLQEDHMSLQDQRSGEEAPLALTHVCKGWRRITSFKPQPTTELVGLGKALAGIIRWTYI